MVRGLTSCAAGSSASIRRVEPSSSVPALEGLAIEAVEWLPSGSDSGLVRVRGRWTDLERREEELPGLGVRRGEELRRFDSLPDARFGRDPAVWRATFLVPAALMDPSPDELWLSWESGVRAGLPAAAHGFQPPPAPPSAPVEAPGGEVIDRGVLAERRARRAEAAERAQALRAAEALKAVEVLELRSAELERRLEALQAQPPAVAELPAPVDAPPEPAPEPVPDAATAAALETAVATVKRLRSELDEQRQRLRKSELMRSADAVALASSSEQRGRVTDLEEQLAESERRLIEAVDAAEARAAEALAAREQAAEQVALARQRAAADAAAVREQAAAELASGRERAAAAEAAAAEARTGAEAAVRELASEQMAHAGTRERLAARETELASIAAEIADLRAELEGVRRDAAGRAAELDRRLADLDAALAAERRAHSDTATELETARAQLAAATAASRAEVVARAALDEEIDRERLARDALAEALDDARGEEAGLRSELAHARAGQADLRSELTRAHALQSELVLSREEARAELARGAAEATELRAALGAVRADLETARGRIAELEADLDRRRGALASVEQETGGLLQRIADLERAADDDLARRASEQAAAAAAVVRPQRSTLAADLDAAAAALRARVAAPADSEVAEPAVAPAEPEAVSPVVEAPAAAPAEPEAVSPAVEEPPAPAVAVAAPRPARPRIVTEPGHPTRADVVGKSKREYPWLRGALVKLAHDDPRAATRLLLGLVPVQHVLLDQAVEYDLTIRGSGTYAISVGADSAAARTVAGPRPRREAAFHVAADIVTLTELLAGVNRRMGRWFAPVKVTGRRRGAEVLRDALRTTDLDLAATARAGADLDPDLVFRSFAYAIHPAWTKGHTFTVTQELEGATPQHWHVAVADGAPVAVERRPPSAPPDATVRMSRTAFAHVLRSEPAPRGDRPAIRGDRAAVALLKAWTDRAQGRAG